MRTISSAVSASASADRTRSWHARARVFCGRLARGTSLAIGCAAIALTVLASTSGVQAEAAKTVKLPPPLPLRPTIKAERLGNGPVIYQGMPGLKGELGDNIDGPSVIKAPSWLKKPLGKYYMYFAHHRGKYIRLAYADRPQGPWHIYKPGTLRLSQMTHCYNHVASPDALVDNANKRLFLYFHCPKESVNVKRARPYAQVTHVATSQDGIHFKPIQEGFAAPYLKVFRFRGYIYGLGMSDKKSAYPVWLRSGQFYRSKTGMPPFQSGPRILDEMRHAGLLLQGHILHVFYTVVGDIPERIYHSQVDLRPNWTEWTATAPTQVLSPEKKYEGGDLPIAESRGGMSVGRERALRDPAILDDNGKIYLYYTVAGEKGIAVARIRFVTPKSSATKP